MIKKTSEGHNILIGTDGTEFFMFDSDRIEEGIHYVKGRNIRNVGLNSYIGFRGTDLSFLLELTDFVEGITIADQFPDLSVLNNLHRLNFLGFPDNRKTTVDLSNFPCLSLLACEYSHRILSLRSCKRLRQLTLTGFRSKDKTIQELPPLPSLKALSLFVTNIHALIGIGRFPLLEELTIFKATNLRDISGLCEIEGSVSKIEFDACKKIESYEILRSLSKLQRLLISNSAAIESLSFIKSLHELEFLSFVGTSVVDGDLTPTFGLDYVGFENRRHYSHTFEEIAAISPNIEL